MMIFTTCAIFQKVTLKFFFLSSEAESSNSSEPEMEKEKRKKKRDPRKVLKQGNKFNFSSYIILKLNSISANFIKKLMIKIFLFLIRESESSEPEGAKKKGAKIFFLKIDDNNISFLNSESESFEPEGAKKKGAKKKAREKIRNKVISIYSSPAINLIFSSYVTLKLNSICNR